MFKSRGFLEEEAGLSEVVAMGGSGATLFEVRLVQNRLIVSLVVLSEMFCGCCWCCTACLNEGGVGKGRLSLELDGVLVSDEASSN